MIGLQRLADHWWVVLLRGVLALLFAAVAFAYPFSTVAAFVVLFGAYALVDGIFAVVAALRFAHPDTGRWWWTLVQGISGIGAGILTFFWPHITAVVLGWLVAFWAISTGVFEIVAGVTLRKNVAGELLMILAGAVSLFLGIVLFFQPLTALLAWVWIVAVYALVAGIALVALALRLRGMRASPPARQA